MLSEFNILHFILVAALIIEGVQYLALRELGGGSKKPMNLLKIKWLNAVTALRAVGETA